MTDHEWISVSEASEKTNIAVETLRRYINRHHVHLRVKKLGKKYFIHDESMTVIERIRALYDAGKNKDEVEEALSMSGVPLTITVKNGHDESMTVHVNDELREIKRELQEQRQFNEQQKLFNMQLLQELKNQQLFYEKKFEELKYDREFVTSLRGSMEQRRLEAAQHEQKTNEELSHINQQLSEFQQTNSENVKELSEHVSYLGSKFEQIVETIKTQAEEEIAAAKEKYEREIASKNEEVQKAQQEIAAAGEKKGFFQRLFGK